MKMKLDSRDLRMLYELDRNARISLKELAKKVRLSKDTALYRLKKLEKEQIILRYQAYLDHGKLGYMSARINLKLQNTTPEKEAEIIQFITAQQNVGFFASVEGNIDLVIWLLVRSIDELDSFWYSISNRYLNYIEKTEVGIYTKIIHYPRSFLLQNKKNNQQMTFTSCNTSEKIEPLDKAILKLLTINARESIVSMARTLKVSPKTISTHIKDLEKRKIITGYTCLLNTEKLGYSHYKIYLDLQNTSEQILRKLDQFIVEHPNIIYRDDVIGGHACEIEVQVKNEKELRNVIEQIKEEFSSIIRSYEVLHYFKEHKMLSMPWAN